MRDDGFGKTEGETINNPVSCGYYLGIDGGGTKTVFAVYDFEGSLLTQYQTTSADYRQIGIEGLKKLLLEGTKALVAQAPDFWQRLAGVCIGVPNYTEVATMDRCVEQVVYEVFPQQCTLIVNDSEVGWAGSLGLKPGINLVSGTGSISFGRNRKGQSATVGGWSDFFSDEGSCRWLGIRCLELFSKEADGRLPKGALYRLVMEHFNLEKSKDLIALVDDEFRSHRAKIASLQRILAQAARENDAAALQAYEQAANELLMIVKATASALKLPEGESVDVACSGGLFNRRSPILPIMRRKLEENRMCWISPRFLPQQGAVLLAAEHTGRKDVAEQMKGKWEQCI